MSNNPTTKPEAGETRYDHGGPIRVMAVADNWIMCRRPGFAPWCMSTKDWAKLSATDECVGKSSAPRATHYGVLA